MVVTSARHEARKKHLILLHRGASLRLKLILGEKPQDVDHVPVWLPSRNSRSREGLCLKAQRRKP